MPTITESRARIGLPAGIAAALLAWFGGMTLLALLIKPQNVVAFGAPAPLAQTVAALEGDFLSAGKYFVTLRTDRADTVRQLYANGAWLVWPVLNGGCRGANGRG
jgi:hypothetical protein